MRLVRRFALRPVRLELESFQPVIFRELLLRPFAVREVRAIREVREVRAVRLVRREVRREVRLVRVVRDVRRRFPLVFRVGIFRTPSFAEPRAPRVETDATERIDRPRSGAGSSQPAGIRLRRGWIPGSDSTLLYRPFRVRTWAQGRNFRISPPRGGGLGRRFEPPERERANRPKLL